MGSTAMKGNTTDGHVVNGVARQVKMPSYWLCDVFAVIPYVQLMLAKTISYPQTSNRKPSDVLVNAVTRALSLKKHYFNSRTQRLSPN